MKTNEKDAEVVKDLIKINNDRTAGYEKAIKETQGIDEDLRGIFEKMARDSKSYASELEGQIGNLDGKASQTTDAGKIYRVWMDVKTTVSGNSRQSVLSACEFGEDAAQKAYKEALKTEGISNSVKTILSKQQEALKSSHDVIREWRDREKNMNERKSSSL